MTTETEKAPAKSSHSEDLSDQHEAIRKEIRSWGLALLIFGVLHIVASGFLSSSFGVMLIVVGLASFYFRSAAMLVVYATTLAWAGISNLTSGEWGWIAFAVLQGFICFRVLRRFLQYRQAEAVLEVPADVEASGLTPQRSAKVFPWAGLFLGGFSLLALVGTFGSVIILLIVSPATETVPPFLNILEGLAVSAAVLGFALGLASLLCRYRWKIAAIIGMVGGLLTLIIELVVGLIL